MPHHSYQATVPETGHRYHPRIGATRCHCHEVRFLPRKHPDPRCFAAAPHRTRCEAFAQREFEPAAPAGFQRHAQPTPGFYLAPMQGKHDLQVIAGRLTRMLAEGNQDRLSDAGPLCCWVDTAFRRPLLGEHGETCNIPLGHGRYGGAPINGQDRELEYPTQKKSQTGHSPQEPFAFQAHTPNSLVIQSRAPCPFPHLASSRSFGTTRHARRKTGFPPAAHHVKPMP